MCLYNYVLYEYGAFPTTRLKAFYSLVGESQADIKIRVKGSE
ncbi:unnamed protein product, partial [Larinioides sclopetarius]